MPIYFGASKAKFSVGNKKVIKMYQGAQLVYSSGNVCNYYVNGSLVHTQEYDEGQSVLSPSYTVPSVSGRVFKGWSTTNGGQPAGSLTMGDSPISLYARFNYIVTYNFNGRNYTQEYDEGQSVLSPSVVYPAITGATFLGWVTSRTATTPLTNLTMGSDPITLYALFKWADTDRVNQIGLRISFGQPYNINSNEINATTNHSGTYTYPMDTSKYDRHYIKGYAMELLCNNNTVGQVWSTSYIDGVVVKQYKSPYGGGDIQTIVDKGVIEWTVAGPPTFTVADGSSFHGGGTRNGFYVESIRFLGKTTTI